ncbi:hypothetical protein BHE74_00046473 [Ensete ventricosum]|nr:hypothetical protein BHE74_00046473 [Ensete ventricosum]RZS04633.1 hypothetical protein BHM03_00034992 [Ensete ventricosum]
MAAKGSSDGGGRRGQQQRQLQLRCDFVATSGVDCNKGAATIGGRRGSDVHGCCGGGQQCMEREMAAVVFNLLAAIKIVGCDVNKLQQKIAAGSFLSQGSLLAMINEDDNERLLLAALGSERCVLRLKG